MHLSMLVLSFMHSTQSFVPKDFWTDTGFPGHRIENFIRVRRIFGVGLGSLVIVDAKCFANVSEFCFSLTSRSTSA